MKKLVFAFLSGMILFSACQPKVDIEKEKGSIKAVLEGETAAFLAKDLDKLSSFYVQDELNTRLQQTCSIEHPIYSGWSNVKSFLETMMKESGNEDTSVKNSKEDLIIKIKGDCAWVVNKDVWSWEANGKPATGYGIQTTFMEKIDGNWKISMFSYFYRDQVSEVSKDTTVVK
jgi:ketosteroid isomerase-like protein